MKKIYSWVPWFQELANKILKEGEEYLIKKTGQVDWISRNPAILRYGEKGIDPLSFFYFLAQKNTARQREKVYRSVHEVFQLKTDLPEPVWYDTFVFPTPQPAAVALFHNGEEFFHETLWEFFRKCMCKKESIEDRDFSNVLKIPQVGVAKTTQCLFLINPEEFIPADKTLPKSLTEFRDLLEGENGWSTYLKIAEQLRKTFPGCELYEVSRALFLYSTEYSDRNSSYFSVTTDIRENPDLPADSKALVTNTGKYGNRWKEFESNNAIRICPIRQEFNLDAVSAGDIILVRKGKSTAYGMGVVEMNDHSNGEVSESSRIHVIWLNKSRLDKDLTDKAQFHQSFMLDGPTENGAYRIFRNAKEYEPTFNFIESLKENGGIRKPMAQLNQILYGPPGTGKTYLTTKMCVEICDGSTEGKDDGELRERFRELRDEEERVEFVTFHQSYGYEEFVEGLRPVSDNSESKMDSGHSESPNSTSSGKSSSGFSLDVFDGVLKRIAKRARGDEDGKPYVLVIDEINRANISKVLGELVTLLEEDKRDGGENEVSVTLPYSGKPFTLPSNLYILGTMNTADRSIALLDTALRRRFEFKEMPPDLSTLIKPVEGVDLKAVLGTINNRLEYLIDRDHLIGHAWFIKCRSKEEIDGVMRSKIIPLLAEYFYDDWNKVRSVLGGGDHFIGREKLAPPPGMEDDTGEDRYRWFVREDEFDVKAYENLVKPTSAKEADE